MRQPRLLPWSHAERSRFRLYYCTNKIHSYITILEDNRKCHVSHPSQPCEGFSSPNRPMAPERRYR